MEAFVIKNYQGHIMGNKVYRTKKLAEDYMKDVKKSNPKKKLEMVGWTGLKVEARSVHNEDIIENLKINEWTWL